MCNNMERKPFSVTRRPTFVQEQNIVSCNEVSEMVFKSLLRFSASAIIICS